MFRAESTPDHDELRLGIRRQLDQAGGQLGCVGVAEVGERARHVELDGGARGGGDAFAAADVIRI